MTHKPWVSVAAHQLCDAAGLAQEQRFFAYQANEEGVWTDVETDFYGCLNQQCHLLLQN